MNALTIDPSGVTAGSTAPGTLVMTNPAPAGGTTVALTSGAPAVPTVTARVTVPAGATHASIPITTRAVAASTPVLITATQNDVTFSTRAATLWVDPGSPPPATPASLTLAP